MRIARLFCLLAVMTVPLAISDVDSQSRPEKEASFDERLWSPTGTRVLTTSGVVALLAALTFALLVWRSRQQSPERVIGAHIAPAVDALRSSAGQVAILDRSGLIVAVNETWDAFASANGVRDLATVGPGINYLEVCARGARAGASGAAAAHDGIEAVCQGRRSEFELEYRSDGPIESVWFQMKVRKVRGDAGGAVVAHHNITALKRREIASRERELSMLVDALPVAVKIVDATGLARHFNTTWLRMTGRTLDDELKRQWIECGHPDDRLGCARAYETAVESRQPSTLEYRVQRPDGSYRWLLDHVIPRYDAEGRFAGVVSASLDITERRRYEERLRELTGQLVTAQENERRRIARELHDDVNQRIALLAIGIDVIRSAPIDERIRHNIDDLGTQAAEIAKAVHSLSHRLHSSALDTLGLVPAVRTLSRELSATGLRVSLIADDDCTDLSPAAALGLFRVIQEALSNVLKHSGTTEAVVTLRHSRDTLRVRVEDRGRGFNPADRADGLGLHSMRERLTLIGGDVRIRSRPGEGTRIEARVPRVPAPVAAQAQQYAS